MLRDLPARITGVSTELVRGLERGATLAHLICLKSGSGAAFDLDRHVAKTREI